MQSSSEQPLVGEEHCVTTLITAAKETTTIKKAMTNLAENLTRTFQKFSDLLS